MKRHFLILLTLGFFVLPLCSTAQFLTEDEPQKEKRRINDKIVYGGNFGFSFGSVNYIELSPKIGYRFKPRFVAGLGAKYTYYNEEIQYYVPVDTSYYTYSYQSKVYGGSIWAQYTLISNMKEKTGMNLGDIVLWSEIEHLNVDAYKIDNAGYYSKDGRTWVTGTLIGGGIYQPIGARAGIYLVILFNLTEELFYPYQNPIIRFGFNF